MQQEQKQRQEERERLLGIATEKLREKEKKAEKAKKSYEEWLAQKNEEKRMKQNSQIGKSEEIKGFIDPMASVEDDKPKKSKTHKKKKSKKKHKIKLSDDMNEKESKENEEEKEKLRAKEIHMIIEEKQSKSSEGLTVENANAKIEELHKEEQKVDEKVKKAIPKKMQKGKKHDPFAEQIFEELSSIQRNSQHGIENENSEESGVLDMEKDNAVKDKQNTSI